MPVFDAGMDCLAYVSQQKGKRPPPNTDSDAASDTRASANAGVDEKRLASLAWLGRGS